MIIFLIKITVFMDLFEHVYLLTYTKSICTAFQLSNFHVESILPLHHSPTRYRTLVYLLTSSFNYYYHYDHHNTTTRRHDDTMTRRHDDTTTVNGEHHFDSLIYFINYTHSTKTTTTHHDPQTTTTVEFVFNTLDNHTSTRRQQTMQ